MKIPSAHKIQNAQSGSSHLFHFPNISSLLWYPHAPSSGHYHLPCYQWEAPLNLSSSLTVNGITYTWFLSHPWAHGPSHFPGPLQLV